MGRRPPLVQLDAGTLRQRTPPAHALGCLDGADQQEQPVELHQHRALHGRVVYSPNIHVPKGSPTSPFRLMLAIVIPFQEFGSHQNASESRIVDQFCGDLMVVTCSDS